MSSREELRETCIKLWDDFSNNTGLHGTNKLTIIYEKITMRTIFYLCILVGLSNYLVYNIVTQIEEYYSYPTITSLYDETEAEMHFPAVTICNLNSLNKSAILNDTRIHNYFLSISPLRHYANPIDWTDAFYQQQNFFQNQTMESILSEHKQLKDSFVSATIFDRNHLNFTDYVSVFISKTGPCVTINPNDTFTTTYKGSTFNLQVWLDIDVENDYYGQAFGEGIKFTVHDPNDDPDFHDSGTYYVKPGHEVFAALSKTKYEYLPYPHQAMPGQYCRSSTNVDGSKYYTARCIKDCYAKYMYDVCGCVDFTADNKEYCSKYDYLNCTKQKDYFIGHPDLLKSCGCVMACDFSKYGVTLTSSTFPSDFYSHLIWKVVKDKELDYYRNNVIVLNIYFDQLKKTVVQQTAKFSSYRDIFANVGGQMGLFCGASLITFTEIIELTLNVICAKLKRQIFKLRKLFRKKDQERPAETIKGITSQNENESYV